MTKPFHELRIVRASKAVLLRFRVSLLEERPSKGLRSLREPQRTPVHRALDQPVCSDLLHGILHRDCHHCSSVLHRLFNHPLDHHQGEKRPDGIMHEDNICARRRRGKPVPDRVLAMRATCHYVSDFGEAVAGNNLLPTPFQFRLRYSEDDFYDRF